MVEIRSPEAVGSNPTSGQSFQTCPFTRETSRKPIRNRIKEKEKLPEKILNLVRFGEITRTERKNCLPCTLWRDYSHWRVSLLVAGCRVVQGSALSPSTKIKKIIWEWPLSIRLKAQADWFFGFQRNSWPGGKSGGKKSWPRHKYSQKKIWFYGCHQSGGNFQLLPGNDFIMAAATPWFCYGWKQPIHPKFRQEKILTPSEIVQRTWYPSVYENERRLKTDVNHCSLSCWVFHTKVWLFFSIKASYRWN